MHLTPREQEKLMIFVASELARKRQRPRPEAELSGSDGDPIRRDPGSGARRQKVATSCRWATSLLTRDDVMEGVPEMIHEVQVEATFPDGTKLVTVHDPIQ